MTPHNKHKKYFFSGKMTKNTNPPICFNNLPVQTLIVQKHPGFHLDSKLNFYYHIEEKNTKENKSSCLLQKLWDTFHINALITVYK